MRCCGLNFQSLLTLTLASGVTWGQGGLIVTSGGDAFGLAPPGPAGSVTLEAEAALDLPAAASALNVAVGETLDLAPGVHDFSEIRVAGTLRLAGDAILRSSGPVVIDGAVVGRQGPQGTDGAELTILGLGPFHLTGTLDCSGASGRDLGPEPQPGGAGGSVTIRTASRESFVVPTVLARGGDADLNDTTDPSLAFGGANGGTVEIVTRGANLVFDGKVLAESEVDPIPQRGAMTPPQTMSFHRGLLTTGGYGGVSTAAIGSGAFGAAGGDGGDIRINCHGKSRLVFRETDLFTGGNVEVALRYGIVLVFTPGHSPTPSAVVQRTGSLGGRGAQGGPMPDGGSGGLGGRAGDVIISPGCLCETLPTSFTLPPRNALIFNGVDPRSPRITELPIIDAFDASGARLYTLQAFGGAGGMPGGSGYSLGICSSTGANCFTDIGCPFIPPFTFQVCIGIDAGFPGLYGLKGSDGSVSCDSLGIPPELRASLRCAASSPEEAYVVMHSAAFPMKAVRVEALDPADPSRVVFEAITGEDGGYLFESPIPGKYRIRASITYTEPSTGTEVRIVNYPEWDAQRTYAFGSGACPKLPTIVIPEPVLLQAGWAGGSGTWDTLFPELTGDPADRPATSQAGLDVPAFLCFRVRHHDEPAQQGDPTTWVYDNSAKSIESHDRNAELLGRWIEDAKQRVLSQWLPAEALARLPVSFVAHSMGTVITRALITRAGSPRVGRVISLEGTHGGTSPFGFLAPLGLPALQEAFMNGMTKNCRESDIDCPLFDRLPWNSTSRRDLLRPQSWLLYSALSDPWVEPDASALGFGRTVPTWPLSLLACEPWAFQVVAGSKACVDDPHTRIHSDAARLREIAVFLAHGRAPEGEMGCPPAMTTNPGCFASEPSGAGGGVEGAEERGTLTDSLTSPAGEARARTFAWDANDAILGQFLLVGSGDYALIAPDGSRLVPDRVQVDALESGATLTTVEFLSPPQGQITLSLTAAPEDPARLEFGWLFANGRSLVVSVDPGFAEGGNAVDVKASVLAEDGRVLLGSEPSFSATIRGPQETSWEIALLDDGAHGDQAAGDGVFGFGFNDTAGEGRYLVTCSGRVTLGSEVVERSAMTTFAVRPAGAVFTGALREETFDPDGDGLFDALVFTHEVAFSRNGSFSLSALLVDSSGGLISQPRASLVNAQGPGSSAAELVVPAEDIARHGVAGSWTLRALALEDDGAGSLPCATLPDHVTAAYAVSAFERPPSPAISWVIPTAGPARGGNEVLLGGGQLEGVKEVFFGRRAASVVAQSHDRVLVLAPPPEADESDPSALPSTVDVVVRAPWGDGVAARAYTYSCEASVGASADCNGNAVADVCDLLSGSSADANEDGVPDECQPPFRRGDCDCDGLLGFADLRSLISLTTQEEGSLACCFDACDVTDDGVLDLADVRRMALALDAQAVPPPPFPVCGLDPTPDGFPECAPSPDACVTQLASLGLEVRVDPSRSEVEATVLLTNSCQVVGLSFGLAHDPSMLRPLECGLLGPLADLAAASGPGSFRCRLDAVPVDGCAGIEAGATLSVSRAPGEDPQVSGIEPGGLQAVAVVRYELLRGVEESELSFVDCLSAEALVPCVIECVGEPSVVPRKVSRTVLNPQPRFLRGDCNGDGETSGSVTDAVFLLLYNFGRGPEPPCLAACDVDGDGTVLGQVSDAVYLLVASFLGGPAPVEPFPACGLSTLPTDPVLGCKDGQGACP